MVKTPGVETRAGSVVSLPPPEYTVPWNARNMGNPMGSGAHILKRGFRLQGSLCCLRRSGQSP